MGFWLIQRGAFNNLSGKYSSLTGMGGLIDLDYMGSSEFEFGAVPKAYRRIMHSFKDYKYTKLKNIKDYKGRELIIFCHKDKINKIEGGIRTFISNPYGLKQYCNLSDHIKGIGFCSENDLRNNFFWCIDRNDSGDWMAFYGNEKLAKFGEAIEKDYNDWWMKKDKKTRENEYKESLNTF